MAIRDMFRRRRFIVDLFVALAALIVALGFLLAPQAGNPVAHGVAGADPNMMPNPPPPNYQPNPPPPQHSNPCQGYTNCTCVNNVCHGSNGPPPPPPPPAGNFTPPPAAKKISPPPPPAGNFAPDLPAVPAITPTASLSAPAPVPSPTPSANVDASLIVDTKTGNNSSAPLGEVLGIGLALGGVALAVRAAMATARTGVVTWPSSGAPTGAEMEPTTPSYGGGAYDVGGNPD